MEKEKLYCILCGAENNATDKFCHSCGQSLRQQETELQDYLKEKVKDKVKSTVKDKATESFLEMLKKFLNSKAYGILMSLSVVAATTTALAGGNDSNVTEFSADIPGQFVDGSIHLASFDSSDRLYSGQYNIYPGPGGSLSQIYIVASYNSIDVDLDVQAGGKTLLTVDGAQVEDGQVFMVSGTNPVFTMYDTDENYQSVIKIDSSFGISYIDHTDEGVLLSVEEYVAPDVLVYRLRKSADGTDDEKQLYEVWEYYYDNSGRPTLWTYVNAQGEETTREEYVYDDAAGTTARSRYEMGQQTVYELTNADGKPLEEIGYIDGEQYSRYLYEYYPSGQTMTYTYYENSFTGHYRTEYYEDGTVKAHLTYDEEGNLFDRTYYDTEGNRIE